MTVKLKDRASIPAVIAEMTLEEKALFVTGDSAFTTFGIERLGIPSARVLDGGTGVNFYQYYTDICNHIYERGDAKGTSLRRQVSANKMMNILENLLTPEKMDEDSRKIYDLIEKDMDEIYPGHKLPGCFPPGMLLGATWDPETVYLCGNAVAKEMDAYKVDMVLGSPNVNIHRDPRNGRVFEGYSEDPCLTVKLAPEFVKGVQDEGLIANVKHFAANNQETHRQNVDEQIPLRALYEIYFPGFKACVQDGGVKSLMSAYNKINGTACAMNPWLLIDVLRKEWGYEGMVVSDWGAAYDKADAVRAGNDLDMPGKRDVTPIIEAVKNGTLDEKALDEAVKNLLVMLLDMPVMKGRRNFDIDREYSREAAFRSAAEGIVLLKNDGLLPLSKGAKLSFIGEHSMQFVESGGGSAVVYTDQSTSMVKESEAITGKENVVFGRIDEASDVVVITAIANGQEGSDRPDMDLEPEEKAMLLAAVREAKEKGKKVVVVLNVAGPVDVRDYVDDCDAMFCVFFPGMEGGRVTAKMLFGEVNPSGKLPLTFPKRYQDCPTYGNFPGCAGEVTYGEGIFVGYRYYDYKDVDPMFPFGFGLSYTTFEIGNLRLDRDTMDMDCGESITAAVTVKNTGAVAGKEVVQLYVQDPVSTLVKPVKELKAFQKVFLNPGEEKEISFVLTAADLASYDPELHAWISEAGAYKVLVGNSSRHIAAEAAFVAKGITAYNYNCHTMLDTVMHDPRAKEILYRHLASYGADSTLLDEYITFFPHMELEKLMGILLMDLYPDDAARAAATEPMYAELHALDLSVLS